MFYFLAISKQVTRAWFGWGKPKVVVQQVVVVTQDGSTVINWIRGDKEGAGDYADLLFELKKLAGAKEFLVDGWDDCLAVIENLKWYPMLDELEGQKSDLAGKRAKIAANMWSREKMRHLKEWFRVVRGIKLEELLKMTHHYAGQWAQFVMESFMQGCDIKLVGENQDWAQIETSKRNLDFYTGFGSVRQEGESEQAFLERKENSGHDEFCTGLIETMVRQLLEIAQ